jgi:hypothetical protein
LRKRILSFSFFIILGTFLLVLQPSTVFAVQPPESYESQIIRRPAVDEICAEPPSDGKGLNSSRLRWLSNLADLGKFKHAEAGIVTGVFVCKMFALDVTQQPANDPVFVSEDTNTATQFRLAANYGTIGLLAHNTHSGSKFFKLTVGQEVDIVYGDGTVRPYVISEIRHFQALNPDSPYTDFVDLDHGGTRFSSTQVFAKFFEDGNRVVFQTCIDAHGKASWGRLFVTAMPVSDN